MHVCGREGAKASHHHNADGTDNRDSEISLSENILSSVEESAIWYGK